MKKTSFSRISLFFAAATVAAAFFGPLWVKNAAADPAIPSGPREFYLLIGQSNMAGRGAVEDTALDPRLFALYDNGKWSLALDPLRLDKGPKAAGVGPGVSFGKALLAAKPGVVVGLVNRAVGGTQIREWAKGARPVIVGQGKGTPLEAAVTCPHCAAKFTATVPMDNGELLLERPLYADAVAAARQAIAEGWVLKGILWHQGESDYRNKGFTAEWYAAQLTELINTLRADLNAPNVPFVAGEICGGFLDERQAPVAPLNEALAAVAKQLPNVGVVPTQDLTDRGDKLHFNTASQVILGQRYAAEMLRLQGGK